MLAQFYSSLAVEGCVCRGHDTPCITTWVGGCTHKVGSIVGSDSSDNTGIVRGVSHNASAVVRMDRDVKSRSANSSPVVVKPSLIRSSNGIFVEVGSLVSLPMAICPLSVVKNRREA